MNKQQGAGLIEVLVTVLILGTSLLALAALQSKSLHYNHSAYLRSQANILAYDLLDRVRVNRANMKDYKLALSAAQPTGTATVVQKDLKEWFDSIATMLPGADGAVDCVQLTRLCTVTIKWAEPTSANVASEAETSFVYTTQI